MLSATTVLFLPGEHSPELTEDLLASFELDSYLVCEVWASYSAREQLKFIQKHHTILKPKIVIVAFSAGAVGASEIANTLQKWGHQVEAMILVDAWGVPLIGDFHKYRLSHDYFTHWSSHLLGGGDYSFYADPGVDHLKMWQSSRQVSGYLVERVGQGCYKYSKTNLKKALEFFILY